MNINYSDTKELEEKTYIFKDKNLLNTALTHTSFANEMNQRKKSVKSNERLEFFGDAILQYISSDILFTRFKKLPEGALTRIRSQIVCEKALYKYAKSLDLGKFLNLGKGEENSNGRERISILADAFEAFIAAIYHDSGLNAVKKFLRPYLENEIKMIIENKIGEDYKSILQSIIQSEKYELFEYVVVEESGPDHNKHFVIAAKLNSNTIGIGEGSSKQEAEQNAAKVALELFGK